MSSFEKGVSLNPVTSGVAGVEGDDDLASDVMNRAAADLQHQGDKVPPTIILENVLRKYSSIYEVSFQKLIDTLKNQAVLLKADILALDQHYNVRRKAGKAGSACDIFRQKRGQNSAPL